MIIYSKLHEKNQLITKITAQCNSIMRFGQQQRLGRFYLLSKKGK